MLLQQAKTTYHRLLSLIALTFLMLASSVNARVQMLDSAMLSLNPLADIEGPIFDIHGDRREYSNDFISTLIEEAHNVGKRYLEQGDTQGYYTFMVLALTVPLHEGLYVQFRQVDNETGLCRESLNDGSRLQNSIARDYFKQIFLETNNANTDQPFALPCSSLAEQDRLTQFIAGGMDGSDVSVMQVNVRWHYDNFLARGDFKSVRKSLRYGFNYLMRGFRPIYANFENYSCLINHNGGVDYTALIRGSWAGQYNSGNITRTCRFADSESPYRSHDQNFQTNLNKTLDLDRGGRLGFNSQLQLEIDTELRQALEEIVSNFKNKTNQRDALEIVLERS